MCCIHPLLPFFAGWTHTQTRLQWAFWVWFSFVRSVVRSVDGQNTAQALWLVLASHSRDQANLLSLLVSQLRTSALNAAFQAHGEERTHARYLQASSPRVPWIALHKECSGRGYTVISVPTKSHPATKELNSLLFANAKTRVHRDSHTCSLKERQILRELHNSPRQMQGRIWKYPSVFQQPITRDWLWKKNCWYDLRTQPTVVRQSAHNDGPSQDNTSSMLTDNLDPNTNNSPMPGYTSQVWRWNGNTTQTAGYLVS